MPLAVFKRLVIYVFGKRGLSSLPLAQGFKHTTDLHGQTYNHKQMLVVVALALVAKFWRVS